MSIAFFNARKKVKRNPRVDFQLKDDETLVFSLKYLREEKLFFEYTKLSKGKFEVKIKDLKKLLDICDSNGFEVITLPDEIESAIEFDLNIPFDESFKERDLYKTMFPYQREGVKDVICKFDGRCLIGDEMGLGKTLQAISVCQYYGHKSVLVICPAYLRYTWKHELEKWLKDIDTCIINKGKDEMRDDCFMIISYELAAKRADEIKDMSFEIVICDESHYLKGHKTKRTKYLTPVVKKIRHVLMLSGTPALNRPCEIFPQAHMIRPEFFKKWKSYTVRYCNGQMSPLGYYDFSGSTNSFELTWLLRKTIMIRRNKRDVLTELPPKCRAELYVPLKKNKVKKMEPLFKEWKELNRVIPQMVPCSEDIKKASFRRKCLISELFRMTSEAKTDMVKTIVKDMVDQGLKFIVFCYHKQIMTEICNILEVPYIRIDGDTKQEIRQDLVNEFQEGDAQVAVLSLLAASTGITLTAANLVLFGELYFVPGTILQAEDRVHRVGQTKTCDIRYIIAEGSLDDHIFKMLYYKLQTLDTILDGRVDREFKGERVDWDGMDSI
jgi:SWI/SNF-related matrix-associated actin-dependent regulator 1 of chromatin subfamily A